MKKIHTIIILAGGDSTRFWPLSNKNLFVFNGKPLLEHQLVRLAPHADQLFVITNKKDKNAISAIANRFGAIVVEQVGNGQAAALLSIDHALKGDALVVNGADIFEDELYTELFSRIEKNTADCLFPALVLESYFPGGILRHKDDKVLEVVEKPGADKMPSKYMKSVVDYFHDFAAFMKVVSKTHSDKDDRYEKSLSAYIEGGADVRFFTYTGRWTTLKYPWHVLDMAEFFMVKLTSKMGRNVSIHKTATIEGDVHFEEGVRVMEYAKISGPAYIGKNTIIATHAMVIQSMIGEDCLIGGYAEVTRSYLGNHVWLHRNYVGDSVLEKNILFGAGAVCANVRFDSQKITSIIKGEKIDSGRDKLGSIIGDNVKIGVNTSLMPGVKVGTGQRIRPAIAVREDMHDKT